MVATRTEFKYLIRNYRFEYRKQKKKNKKNKTSLGFKVYKCKRILEIAKEFSKYKQFKFSVGAKIQRIF